MGAFRLFLGATSEADGNASGTAASTQPAQSSSATGGLSLSGAAATLQPAQSSEATGGLDIAGVIASIAAAHASEAAGGLSIGGTAASTQPAQSSSALSAPPPSGVPVGYGSRRPYMQRRPTPRGVSGRAASISPAHIVIARGRVTGDDVEALLIGAY